MGLIGISGKIGSGKDTVAKMIQYITKHPTHDFKDYEKVIRFQYHNWEIRKFTDKPKDITCMLIGCTREQLEDHDFKNTPLGEEWTMYSYASGHQTDNEGNKSMITTQCSKTRYLGELATNWQTAYKREMTPRLMMQLIGTECGRNILHPNIWVNALFADYKAINTSEIFNYYAPLYPTKSTVTKNVPKPVYPKWIITDVRFPNEADAIKDRGGKVIRIERPLSVGDKFKTTYDDETYEVVKITPNMKSGGGFCYWTEEGTYTKSQDIVRLTDIHPSETALDDYEDWDAVIKNDGTLDDLYELVKSVYNEL